MHGRVPIGSAIDVPGCLCLCSRVTIQFRFLKCLCKGLSMLGLKHTSWASGPFRLSLKLFYRTAMQCSVDTTSHGPREETI